jgi:hypothetical protein
MKKSIAAILLILSLVVFSGCGQQMTATVYSSIPLVGMEWAAVDANTDGNDQVFWPTTYAQNSNQCNSTNSVTFNIKENQTLTVSANGQVITDVSTNSLTAFYVSPTAQVVYGEFLSTPHWYAEVNLASVIFYKK